MIKYEIKTELHFSSSFYVITSLTSTNIPFLMARTMKRGKVNQNFIVEKALYWIQKDGYVGNPKD